MRQCYSYSGAVCSFGSVAHNHKISTASVCFLFMLCEALGSCTFALLLADDGSVEVSPHLETQVKGTEEHEALAAT